MEKKMNFTDLKELAKNITEETLPDLFKQIEEAKLNEINLLDVIEVAAKKLDSPSVSWLLSDFRLFQKQENAKQGGFQFLSIEELYAKSVQTEWLIKPYLDKDALAMLFGISGTLKSFTAIDIGLSIATGKDWHGNPVAPGAVFYICGEGQKGISRRLRAWELHHKINLDGVPFFVSNKPAQFLNEESAMDVVAAVNALRDKHGNPVLIIIDTLNRNFGHGDENNTSDMTTFVNIIDNYLRIQYGCSVLIVHHTGLKKQERARGSYALHAALDWEYQATKHDGMILVLKNTKSKDSESLSSVYLRSKVITLDWVEKDGTAITSLILKRTAANTVRKNKQLTGTNKIAYDSLLEGIKKNGGKPISTKTWRKSAYEAKISDSDKSDSKQKAFKRAKEELLEQGLIETKDDLWRPKKDTGHEADIKGHCPETLRRTDTDTPPIGVSSCPDVRIDGECK